MIVPAGATLAEAIDRGTVKGGTGCRRDLGCALPAVFVKIAPLFFPLLCPFIVAPISLAAVLPSLSARVLGRAPCCGRRIGARARFFFSFIWDGLLPYFPFSFLAGAPRDEAAPWISPFCKSARRIQKEKKRGTPALCHSKVYLGQCFLQKKRKDERQEETGHEARGEKKIRMTENWPGRSGRAIAQTRREKRRGRQPLGRCCEFFM